MLPFFPQDCTRLWTCNLGLVCFRKIIQAIACPLCIGIFIVSHIKSFVFGPFSDGTRVTGGGARERWDATKGHRLNLKPVHGALSSTN